MHMKCPHCGVIETKVVDSRLNQTADITRRRRECIECGGRFTTYERVEEIMPAVLKKNGSIEPFDRSKIMDGIKKACGKRPVTSIQMEDMASRIERKIQSYGLKEIPSRVIGQMVIAELHQVDKVAYVRFASVYRDFQDVDEFVQELQENPPVNLEYENTSLAFPFIAEEENGKGAR